MNIDILRFGATGTIDNTEQTAQFYRAVFGLTPVPVTSLPATTPGRRPPDWPVPRSGPACH
jgi:hypothetical protein